MFSFTSELPQVVDIVRMNNAKENMEMFVKPSSSLGQADMSRNI